MKKTGYIAGVVLLVGVLTATAQEKDSTQVTEKERGASTAMIPQSITMEEGKDNTGGKGSYLTFSVGAGPSGLLYEWLGTAASGTERVKGGGNIQAGYSVFFTDHWGLGTGVGVSLYNSQARYNRAFSDNEYFNLGVQVADNIHIADLHNYELRARLAHWQEDQRIYTFDVPLALQYQTRFGKKQIRGVYAGAGVRFHLPMKSRYGVLDGETDDDVRLNVSGASFTSSNIEYASPSQPPIPQHGFGTIHNPRAQLGWEGDISLKPEVSAIANLGFLWTIAPRVELQTGVFIDYGLTNVKKRNVALLEAPENYSSSFPAGNGNSVGTGIAYNGIVNSQQVKNNTARLFSYGLEIGLRIKLGGKKNASPAVYSEPLPPAPILEAVDTATAPALEPEPLAYTYRVVAINEATGKPMRGVTVDMEGVGVLVTDTTGAAWQRFDGEASFRTTVCTDGYRKTIIDSQIPSEDGTTTVTDTVYLNQTRNNVTLSIQIHYDLDKWDILPQEGDKLKELIDLLKENQNISIILSSHTDSRASDAYNRALSERRAQSAKDYLIAKGIDARRIVSIGYGKTRLLNRCANGVSCSEAEHRMNRRTEVEINYHDANGCNE
ncbi:MAG: OmpA family protein [Dysgonamonadaceae bacterium]|nr:OmpA family protein [Dysgonamonadaceae bacterium]